MKAQKGYGHLVLPFLVMAISLLGCSGEGSEEGMPSANLENHNEQAALKPACDFDVALSEPDFCVIQGRFRDIDVTLVPISGVCNGSAILSVSGLPEGVKKEVFPSSEMQFQKGKAFATVRIDTTGMVLKDGPATSSVTFSASKKGLIRKAKADMKVDLPLFDFSLKPHPNVVQLHQEDSASTTVKVDLLGGACKTERPVSLSLDASSLPPFVSYNFSPKSVIPPKESTLSFQASSGMEIGPFKTTLIGCCTDENDNKTNEITVNILFPHVNESIPMDVEGIQFPEMGETFKVDSMDNILKRLQLPEEALQQTRKAREDIATKGYIEASEEEVHRLKGYEAFFRPMDQVLPLLTFEPASLENTPFSGFRQEGGLAAGVARNGQQTEVRRIFKTSDGAIIQLSESDLITSGGYSVYSKESINADIHGFPAVLTVKQSPSGNAITRIAWTTDTTGYTLEMEGNVKKNGQYDFFLSLARSIPQK